MNFDLLLKSLKKYNIFIITTHVNPDADAIGSEIALFEALQQLGKNVRIINYSSTPAFLKFLDTSDIIEIYNSEIHDEVILSSECNIFLDLNRVYRTVKMEQAFRKSEAYKICIDHHQNPEEVFELIISDTNLSSTGQIIYEFLDYTKQFIITKSMAEAIYSAIMTDTGSFKYDRTTPRVHLIAAKLIEQGVIPDFIYRKIYDESKFGKIRLLGKALSQLELFGENKISVMEVRQQDLADFGLEESDIDGFVNYCLTIENVVLGLLFFELKDGIKVNLRSVGDVPVHKLADRFGGGGHKNASGIRLRNTSVEEMKDIIINESINFLSNGKI